MSRVRFATAKALFDTFPETYKKIGAKPTDQFPIDFLKGLVSQAKLDDAVTFCAYLLPRREAVWWASQCVRALLSEPTTADEAALTPPRNGCASRQNQTAVASWRPGLPPTVPAPGLRSPQAGPAARWWSATTAALRRRRN